jgi:hypothetical protein
LRAFRFSVFFFIPFSLARRHFPRADNPNGLAAIRMGNNQRATGLLRPCGNKPLLNHGAIRVGMRQGQRIAKNRRRIVKGNTVLPAIHRRFARVPFKIHQLILSHARGTRPPRRPSIVGSDAIARGKSFAAAGFALFCHAHA